MAAMKSLERVRAALANEAIDRPAVSLWRHFYESETDAEGLADAMLRWQRQYGWDFMKVNPRAQYHVEPWGARFKYHSDGMTKPSTLSLPVSQPEDWQQIAQQSATGGALGEQLSALNLIKRGLKGDDRVLFVQTVFSPLSVTADMVASEAVFRQHIETAPALIHAALEQITRTFEGYVAEVINLCDGVFFATTEWGSRDRLTAEQYAEFGRPYDLRVLAAAQEAEFNILHVCKGNNMLTDLLDYPVRAFSWAVHEQGNPGLQEMLRQTDKALIGGVSLDVLTNGTPEQIATQINRDLDQADGQPRWLCAPDCSINPQTPAKNVAAVADTVKGMHL